MTNIPTDSEISQLKENTEELTASVQEDLKVLNEFKSKKENIQNAQLIAKQIQDNVSKNWFGINKLGKKLKLSYEESLAQLQLLGIFQLVSVKSEKGEQLFKIDLDQEAQKELIVTEIQALEVKIIFLRERLKSLVNKN